MSVANLHGFKKTQASENHAKQTEVWQFSGDLEFIHKICDNNAIVIEKASFMMGIGPVRTRFIIGNR